MENPGVKIAWGGGPWRKNHKRVVRENIYDATELAEHGIDMLDVNYETPKLMTIWRVAKQDPTAGVSHDATNFDIHIPVHHIKHRKIARNFADLTMTIVHEMTHSIRSEKFEESNIFEDAATEGLAYMSEDLVAPEILVDSEIAFNGVSNHLGHGSDYDSLKNRLHNSHQVSLEDEERLNIELDQWFSPYGSMLGVALGINEVCRRLSEGNEFNDLMQWPAEAILDVSNSSTLHY